MPVPDPVPDPRGGLGAPGRREPLPRLPLRGRRVRPAPGGSVHRLQRGAAEPLRLARTRARAGALADVHRHGEERHRAGPAAPQGPARPDVPAAQARARQGLPPVDRGDRRRPHRRLHRRRPGRAHDAVRVPHADAADHPHPRAQPRGLPLDARLGDRGVEGRRAVPDRRHGRGTEAPHPRRRATDHRGDPQSGSSSRPTTACRRPSRRRSPPTGRSTSGSSAPTWGSSSAPASPRPGTWSPARC